MTVNAGVTEAHFNTLSFSVPSVPSVARFKQSIEHVSVPRLWPTRSGDPREGIGELIDLLVRVVERE